MKRNEDTNVVETDTEPGLVADWAELTYECLINILSRLTFEHRWRGPMLVCKGWLIACKDPSLNTLFDLDTQFDSVIESPRWWTPDFERKIDSMILSVVTFSDGSLTEIRTQHCSDLSVTFAAER
jgi:F-box/leucine-rich repeat protein 2/20